MSVRPDPRLRRALESGLPDPSPRPGAKARIRAAIAAQTEAGHRFRQTRGYFVAAALAALVVVAMAYVQRRSPSREVAPLWESATTTTDTASTLVLSSGASVLVQPGSDVRVERDDELETKIRLVHGRMLARVSKREGKPFVVHSRDVRVEVVGTIFAVEARDPLGVSVSVVAGMVDVSQRGDRRRLAPGETWPSGSPRTVVTVDELAWAHADARAPRDPATEPAAPAREMPPELVPAPRSHPPRLTAAEEARSHAGRVPSPYGAAKELESRGDLQGALERYDALASSSEPYAEHALFAAARLRAKLGEKDGALEAFRSYRRRYPDGAYASVVSVHVLDLLLQRGDDREVLGEADAFLAAHPSDPRAWRFRMARGAIAIKNGDCAAALRDLASVPDAQAIPLRRRCAAPSPSSR